MIIILFGKDTYRSKQKLKEIVAEYKKNHQSGLNFIKIDFKEQDLPAGKAGFSDFKQAIETVSMFDEKKLILVEDIFQQSNSFQDELLDYLKIKKIADNKDLILVFWIQEVDSKNRFFKFLKNKANAQEFKLLLGSQLKNWIRNYVKKYDASIEDLVIEKIISFVGNDLWQMSNELDKLVAFNKKVLSGNIDKLIKPKIDVNIFELIDALGQKNKKRALKLVSDHLKKGESEMYLLDRFIYQFRNLIKVKSGGGKDLHPFVFKKNQSQARSFSFDELKKIYHKLFEIDLNIKTGKIDARTALELFVVNL